MIVTFIIACIGTLIVFPVTAAAYVDPATGSIILQVAIGGLLTAVAATKLYWKRLRSLFRRDRRS
jgi:hypothetical protein